MSTKEKGGAKVLANADTFVLVTHQNKRSITHYYTKCCCELTWEQYCKSGGGELKKGQIIYAERVSL